LQREERKEGGRKGWRKGGREGGREGGKTQGRKEEREEGREGRNKRGREEGKKGGREAYPLVASTRDGRGKLPVLSSVMILLSLHRLQNRNLFLHILDLLGHIKKKGGL